MQPAKDGKQGSQLPQAFLGVPVLKRSTESSYPVLSLETETYRSLDRSLGTSVGRVPLPLTQKGGPDSTWQEVDQRAEVAFASKDALNPTLSSVSKSFGSLAFSSPKPRPLVCPVFYEPNSSFFAKKSPDEIFDAIMAQLKKRNISYEFEKLKNKIHVVMYSDEDSAPCTFKINLFKAPENTKKAKFLVEIQRRFGCVVVFRRFYQQFLQALVTEGVAIPFAPLKPAAEIQPTLSQSQVTLDKTSLDLLLRNIGTPSKFSSASLESLRETLRVLANLSRASQNKEFLVHTESERSTLFEILLSALKLPDGEVRRCGATLLSNIATVKTIRAELITKLATCMFQTLDDTSDSVSVAGFMAGSLMEKESQRQIAKALANITETHASEIIRQSNYPYFQEVLQKQTTSLDEVVRKNVQTTISNLS